MAPQIPPLDETSWSHEALIPTFNLGPELNNNNVLWYFMNSTFYDSNSNNHGFIDHIYRTKSEADRNAILFNRERFEDGLLKTYPKGLQFVVVMDPQGPGQGWVFQRQNRKDLGGGRVELVVEGVYYTVGKTILMAPSMLDVVRLRLQSVSTLLQDYFNLGRALTHYTPAAGTSYMPPDLPSTKDMPSAPGIATGSRAPSLGPSEPDASQLLSVPQHVGEAPTDFNDDFFMASFRLATTYGHEFADENPLQGEPGAFVFANSNQKVEAGRSRAQAQAAAQAAVQGVPASTTAPPADAIKTESVGGSAAPTPTPRLPAADLRKGSVAGIGGVPGPKDRRRKSKGSASPATATAP